MALALILGCLQALAPIAWGLELLSCILHGRLPLLQGTVSSRVSLIPLLMTGPGGGDSYVGPIPLASV